MYIDSGLYSSNLFHKQLIDHILENEYKLRELQNLSNNIKRELVGYANQLPYHAMAPIAPNRWNAPYSIFENNYVSYWSNSPSVFPQQDEQVYRHNFKTAIDAASYATKDSSPVASIVFDSIGLMTASNFLEAVIKTLSIIEKASRL